MAPRGFTYNAADSDKEPEIEPELMALPKDRGIRRGEGERRAKRTVRMMGARGGRHGGDGWARGKEEGG
eukprot:4378906-Pyramimonas_sp.AAC.1